MTGQQGSDQLRAALRVVAEDDERLGASAAVAVRLRGELELTRRARRAAAVKMCAAAAVLVAAVSGAVWSVGRALTGPQRADERREVAPEQTTPFFALHYSSVPAREAQIVRVEVPRAALARFGLGGGGDAPNDASATVLADVIVGSDGLARAIRFVGIEEPRQ